MSDAGHQDEDAADARRTLAGDGTAFAGIVQRWQGRLVNLAWRFCRDRAMAEDMAQEAFVRAFRSLHTFRGEAAFGTWLHRLAVNVILARRKTLGGERRRFHEDGEILEVMSGRAEAPEHGVDFEAAINRLPDGAREVFLLHDVQGFRHEEIAQMLGIVPGTSKSQLHHARMALRKYLDR